MKVSYPTLVVQMKTPTSTIAILLLSADPNTSEKERADLATAKSKLSSAVNSLAGAQTDPATGLSNDSRFTGIGYRPEYYPFSHNEKSKGPSGILALFLIYLE